MRKYYIFLLLLVLVSCTANQRARSFGGTEIVTLKENEILQNMTWKGNQMWIQTKDTITGISYFREKSSFGWIEGEIIIK